MREHSCCHTYFRISDEELAAVLNGYNMPIVNSYRSIVIVRGVCKRVFEIAEI